MAYLEVLPMGFLDMAKGTLNTNGFLKEKYDINDQTPSVRREETKQAETAPYDINDRHDQNPKSSWDEAEAKRLLADLLTAVERVKRVDFWGNPPQLFLRLAPNTIAIAEDYIRHHDFEAARGWDVLELLRDQKQVLRGIVARVKAGVASDNDGG
jgi:hypothetical protein